MISVPVQPLCCFNYTHRGLTCDLVLSVPITPHTGPSPPPPPPPPQITTQRVSDKTKIMDFKENKKDERSLQDQTGMCNKSYSLFKPCRLGSC
ncbi:unnamed protein product, partial [Gadus morhua 'NCC']